jgi:hypothetical protein
MRNTSTLYIEKNSLCYTYHSRLIPEAVAEASQIFLRDAHVLRFMRNTAEVTGGKPIAVTAVYLSCKCYESFSHLLRHPWEKERGAILLLCPDTTRDALL